MLLHLIECTRFLTQKDRKQMHMRMKLVSDQTTDPLLQSYLFVTEIIDEKTVIQHNCLGITPYYAEIRGYFEIVSYCLSELPSMRDI